METKTPQLEDGYIQIANEVAEALAKCMPGGTEAQVLFVILRKTWGWHKKEDAISLSQFCQATGKSKRSIIYALQNLEVKKMISIKRTTESHLKQPNLISFNKIYSQWVVQNVAPLVENNRNQARVSSAKLSSSAKDGKRVVQKSVKNLPSFAHTKETITKDNNTKDSIESFIFSFNEFYNTKFRITPKVRKQLGVRLKTYTFEQILEALKNMSEQKWTHGNNDRNWIATPEYFLRSDENIDKYLNMKLIQSKGGVTKV